MYYILATLFIILIIFWIVKSDADLTLTLYEHLCGAKHVEGQVMWITGASTGIGAACSLAAAKLGAKLVLSARSLDKLNEVKQKCLKSSSLGEQDILVLQLDMTALEKHKEAFDNVLDHFGQLDILINNAGRSQRAKWEDIDIDVDRQMFELNVFSVVNLCRIYVRHLQQNKKSGTIALVSSVAGKFGVPYSGSYTGSKHALNGYFESLRSEKISKRGLNICIICPGPVFSDLLKVAATETPGEQFGLDMDVTDNRMKTDRCAHLIMVAISNYLKETWIAKFPVLPLLYCATYLPSISKSLLAFLGPRFLLKLRDSRQTVKHD